jgi:small subunit ribosomal protein S15Ae
MVKVDLVADNLRTMVNAERLGRKQVMLKTSSKTMVRFLRVMQKHGYVGEFEIIDDHRQ